MAFRFVFGLWHDRGGVFFLIEKNGFVWNSLWAAKANLAKLRLSVGQVVWAWLLLGLFRLSGIANKHFFYEKESQ